MAQITKEVREFFSTTYFLETKPRTKYVVQCSEEGIWYVYISGKTVRTADHFNTRIEAEGLAKRLIAGIKTGM